jgi:hypothetical protein
VFYRRDLSTDIPGNALFSFRSVGGREMRCAFARSNSAATSPSGSSSCHEIHPYSLNRSPSRDDDTLSVDVEDERLARQASALVSELCEDWSRASH